MTPFSPLGAIHPPAPRDTHHEQYEKAGIEASTSSLCALCTVDSVAVVGAVFTAVLLVLLGKFFLLGLTQKVKKIRPSKIGFEAGGKTVHMGLPQWLQRNFPMIVTMMLTSAF